MSVFSWGEDPEVADSVEEEDPSEDGTSRSEPVIPPELEGVELPESDDFTAARERANALSAVVAERTVDVHEELDEDAFFRTTGGHTTLVNRYDLEKAVPFEKKRHFREVERYWVNKPFSFIVIFHSVKENERKYYVVEPHLTPIEAELREFLAGKLRTAIKYESEDVLAGADGTDRSEVIERETRRLLDRYDVVEKEGIGVGSRFGLRSLLSFGRSSGNGRAGSAASSGGDGRRTVLSGLSRMRPSAGARTDDGGSPAPSETEESTEPPDREEPEWHSPRSPDRSSTPGADADEGDATTQPTGEGPSAKSSGRRFGLGRLPSLSLGGLLRRGDGAGATDEPESSSGLTLGGLLGGSEEAEWSEGVGPLDRPLAGLTARPEPVLVEEDRKTLSEYQVEKLLYVLKRDFIGYERIDAIKHDINVEDISCDGYDSPVFVYHTEYENVISNVYHGRDELDDFVVKLAQRSGKGISKRQPQVDATLPDGSRAQLTLGKEVSDHGTNYTIRQFKDVPFTPVDLINWRTFSLQQMALLWLAIENNKSLIFAGGTASGKTTSLNAVSLFIPSNTKIVSIEDTREVELPQRNWIASVTRPSFSGDDRGDIDEFDLLEAALRQRPDYIVMGEIRGEEGRTLFQVMSTGHTTYTTFHADSVGEVLKRFTTEPINVSKTLFTALDLVSVQTQTRVQGRKVRRSKSITEINDYNAEHDEINVQDIYQWRAEGDEFEEVGRSNVLERIRFDRGWDYEELREELEKRKVVLAYLVRNGLKEYAQVAATIQAFISDPETVLGLIASGELEERLSDLREMESVEIDIDPETEALVPRPDPPQEVYELTGDILSSADSEGTGVLTGFGSAGPSAMDLRRALDEAFKDAQQPLGRSRGESGGRQGSIRADLERESDEAGDGVPEGVSGEADGEEGPSSGGAGGE